MKEEDRDVVVRELLRDIRSQEIFVAACHKASG